MAAFQRRHVGGTEVVVVVSSKHTAQQDIELIAGVTCGGTAMCSGRAGGGPCISALRETSQPTNLPSMPTFSFLDCCSLILLRVTMPLPSHVHA